MPPQSNPEPTTSAQRAPAAQDLAPSPWRRLATSAGLLDEQGNLASTIFEEMSFLANRHDAINLGQGFPDTDGPEILRESLARAVDAGTNQYATIAGNPRLREEIATHEERAGRRRPDPAQEVTVTAGATEALSATMQAFLAPGHEVILFEPCYDLYPAIAGLTGATIRTVPLRPPHFRADPAEVAAAFSDRTRMVVVNDPHNPTGAVMDQADLREIVDLCVRHDALILTDSVYEHLSFGRDPVDVAALPGAADRTIRVSAASKTFSITGWRIGWAIASPDLTRGLRVTKGYLSHSPAAPMQAAVAEAMTWARENGFYAELRRDYEGRRDLMMEGLSGTSLEPVRPDGTFFAVARIGDDAPAWGRTGTEFAGGLPEHAGVAVVPLSAFSGPENRGLYEDWVRFAFCKRPEVLREAVARLTAAGL